jgi:hypothetical protein
MRTGGRVAEGAGLENRYTGNGIVGSNPTLSANFFFNLREQSWTADISAVFRHFLAYLAAR